MYALHLGQVDDYAPIVHGIPGDVVAAAPDGNQQMIVAGEINSLDNIGDPCAPRYKGRSPVDHSISYDASVIVSCIAGLQQRAA